MVIALNKNNSVIKPPALKVKDGQIVIYLLMNRVKRVRYKEEDIKEKVNNFDYINTQTHKLANIKKCHKQKEKKHENTGKVYF